MAGGQAGAHLNRESAMNKPLAHKLLALVLLALVLAFGISQVSWKVQERQATRDGAVRSIADQYAREQQLAGPLLWVKCSEPRILMQNDDRGEPHTRNVLQDCSRSIRPSQLVGQGNMEVSERYRGIYKARVYLAAVKAHARLPGHTFKPGQKIEEVHLIFGVSDPRGLKHIALTDGQGRPLNARPGVPGGPFAQGFHVPLDAAVLERGLDLDLALEIAGSGRLDWAPLAENNDFTLRSVWPHPSFAGQFLPETRDISGTGFTARWRVNDFATGGERMLDAKTGAQLSTTLGVSLIDPVDAYTQTDRAVRYGFLFVLLTLGGFFLFELLKSRPVHPLQYLLIGFAVVLFFLLLLALSEHLAFHLAYPLAAGACVLLIGAYGRTLVGHWRGAASLGAGYALLYLGLYQLLASEDYALLLGTWLIFALLALTMYLTRRLDWGRVGQTTTGTGVAQE
jgi:inner membrane protein